ncbi:hypothetical protein ACFRAE_05585 [Sphingobacterium sp. HJSM2_6]|uniref:hypothetical protein n=1 Tax=Sphingobacterium sp. HJSM2_6 TaxID=3366264 RepID=UPI003BD0C8A7
MNNIAFAFLMVLIFSSCEPIKKSYHETVNPNPNSHADQNARSINRAAIPPQEKKELDISLYASAERLDQIQQELLNLPLFKGKSLMAYQGLYFYDFRNGHISLKIQNPDILENIDEYIYTENKWQEPIPVKITGNVPLEHSLFPLNKVKFSVAKIVHDQMLEEAKSMEGGTASTHVYFNYINLGKTKRYYWYSSVTGARKDLYIDFDLEGKEINRR